MSSTVHAEDQLSRQGHAASLAAKVLQSSDKFLLTCKSIMTRVLYEAERSLRLWLFHHFHSVFGLKARQTAGSPAALQTHWLDLSKDTMTAQWPTGFPQGCLKHAHARTHAHTPLLFITKTNTNTHSHNNMNRLHSLKYAPHLDMFVLFRMVKACVCVHILCEDRNLHSAHF